MAYPPFAEIDNNYTAFQQGQGDNGFPGQQMDVDLANLKFAVDDLNRFVRKFTTSTGRLIVDTNPVFPEHRTLKISEYLQRNNGDADAAFEEGINELYNRDDRDYFDGEGLRLATTRKFDVKTLAGVDVASVKWFRNFHFDVQNEIENEEFSLPATTTTDSPIVTVASTTGLRQGMHVAGTGIQDRNYILSVDSATQFTLTRNVHSGGTPTLTITDHAFLLDFAGFSSSTIFDVAESYFQCNGFVNVIRGPKRGTGCNIESCRMEFVRDYGALMWGDLANAIWFDGNEVIGNLDVGSAGFVSCTNDVYCRGNRFNRLHTSTYFGGSGNVILGNHLWGPTDGLQRVVLANRSWKTLIVGNYIDNGHIELSNEGRFLDGGMLDGVSITGNIFTASGAQPTDFTWIKIRPFGAAMGVTDVVVSDNVFWRLVDPDLVRVDSVIEDDGTISVNSYARVYWQNNVYENVTHRVQNPCRLRKVLATGDAASSLTFDFADKMPWGGPAKECVSLGMSDVTDAGGRACHPSWRVQDDGETGVHGEVQIDFALDDYLTGSKTYDPGNLADGAGETTTVTVTGAAGGDFASASWSANTQGVMLDAWVSAADTVTVRFQNETGGAVDLLSGTLRVRVRPSHNNVAGTFILTMTCNTGEASA